MKRPEILETVYSVEEKDGEEGEKVKEKENDEMEKEKGENRIKADEEEEEKRVEGLIPCFCRKYLGRARVTRLTERGCKKLLEALSLNAAQQVVDKCRLCRGKIEC